MKTISNKTVDIREVRSRAGKANTLAQRLARRKNLNRGPANNRHAETHGFYRVTPTPEESAAREAFEQAMTEDLGGQSVISASQRTLISTAGMLEMKRARVDRAIQAGCDAPAQEHVLALVNSLRLILCALGLAKRQGAIDPLEAVRQAVRKANR